LGGLKNLKTLCLTSPHVTTVGVRVLRAALPDCEIRR
jgi:hypothetical protein